MAWLSRINDIVMTTRIRLARNLAGYPLPHRLDACHRREIVKEVAAALGDSFNHFSMAEIDQIESQSYIERHLVSPYLVQSGGSVFLSRDKALSVMVNEEDHIREQCIMEGLAFLPALNAINSLDKDLIMKLKIAFSEDYGFLTSCMTNLGTGIRASVMVFLPALCIRGEIDQMTKRLVDADMTIRGTYGEGTGATSYLFQISNRTTLGKTEEMIIDEVYENAEYVVNAENTARKAIETDRNIRTPIQKSLEILQSGNPLGVSDFITHFCKVKLGIGLGHFSVTDLRAFNKLIDDLQEATLIVNKKIIPDKHVADRERGKIAEKEMKKLIT